MTWIGCVDLTDWGDLHSETHAAEKWCSDPTVPPEMEHVSGAVACRADLDVDLLERRLRGAGLPPLSIPVVLLDPDEAGDRDRIRARIIAAAARAAAAPPVAAEHLRLTMPAVPSRRTLLSFRTPAYRLVPRPDQERCGAGDGCRACVAECPHGALTWAATGIVLDRLDCSGCGRCVVACPAGAMVHPHTTPAQLDAFVEAVAREVDGAFGVRFVCSRGVSPPTVAGWFDLPIPCVGMVRPGWLLAPLLDGASEVTIAGCSCGIEGDVAERVEAVLGAAQEILVAADIPTRRIPKTPTPIGRRPLDVDAPGSGFEPSGVAHAAAALGVETYRGPLVDAGVVTIDGATCTGCEMCSTVCPSGALAAASDADGLTITFEALRCTACGECVRTCPEPGAIAVDRRLDGAAATLEAYPLVSHALAMCTKCGGPVATETVLDRLAARLDDDVVFRQISSLCLDCRGTTMVF